MPNGSQVKTSNQSNQRSVQALLKWHRLHNGVYARVARRLGVDPSFVSRVAKGERRSEKIQEALVSELTRIHTQWPASR